MHARVDLECPLGGLRRFENSNDIVPHLLIGLPRMGREVYLTNSTCTLGTNATRVRGGNLGATSADRVRHQLLVASPPPSSATLWHLDMPGQCIAFELKKESIRRGRGLRQPGGIALPLMPASLPAAAAVVQDWTPAKGAVSDHFMDQYIGGVL